MSSITILFNSYLLSQCSFVEYLWSCWFGGLFGYNCIDASLLHRSTSRSHDRYVHIFCRSMAKQQKLAKQASIREQNTIAMEFENLTTEWGTPQKTYWRTRWKLTATGRCVVGWSSTWTWMVIGRGLGLRTTLTLKRPQSFPRKVKLHFNT